MQIKSKIFVIFSNTKPTARLFSTFFSNHQIFFQKSAKYVDFLTQIPIFCKNSSLNQTFFRLHIAREKGTIFAPEYNDYFKRY